MSLRRLLRAICKPIIGGRTIESYAQLTAEAIATMLNGGNVERVAHCSNCFDSGFLGDLERLCASKSRDGICVEADKSFLTKSYRVALDKAIRGDHGLVEKVYGCGFVAATKQQRLSAEDNLEYRALLLNRVEERIDLLVRKFDEIAPEIPDGEPLRYFDAEEIA